MECEIEDPSEPGELEVGDVVDHRDFPVPTRRGTVVDKGALRPDGIVKCWRYAVQWRKGGQQGDLTKYDLMRVDPRMTIANRLAAS